MRNGLGVVQGHYNFIEANTKRYVISREKLNMNRHIGNRDKRNALGLREGGGSGQEICFFARKTPKPN